VTETTAHSIVWTFDRDTVTAKAICEDEDCINRYGCVEECEVIYDIRRDESGATHGVYDWEGEIKPHLRHEMTKGTFCNVVEYLNADPSLIPELHDGPESFEIGRTAIEPAWQGDDGVLWNRPTPSPVPQTGEPNE
jgi:hypothetical protein